MQRVILSLLPWAPDLLEKKLENSLTKMSLNPILKKIEDPEIEIYRDFDLTKYNTLRLKSTGNLLVIKSVESLQTCLSLLKEEGLDFFVLGWGANSIFPEKFQRPIIKLEFKFSKDEFDPSLQEFHFPASIGLSTLTNIASTHELRGYEVLTGIPATLGGALVMNAGTSLGEIGELVTSFDYLTLQGELVHHVVNSKTFNYRENTILPEGAVIVSATLKNLGIDKDVRSKIKE